MGGKIASITYACALLAQQQLTDELYPELGSYLPLLHQENGATSEAQGKLEYLLNGAAGITSPCYCEDCPPQEGQIRELLIPGRAIRKSRAEIETTQL